MNKLEKFIGIGMLIVAIGFNLWIYRLEPTALSDPNDNTFQYALVERTNQIWDFAYKTCTGAVKPFCMFSLLSDHWVPNWAQGYNLPYYYSHIPQILIVTTYRFFTYIVQSSHISITLFQYYHWIIYLLVSFFPLSLFLALRIIGLSWLASGFGTLIASHLSTDGLYGLDAASFLWRGWGLSSQLFSMTWLPLALAFTYRMRVLPAVLTLAATTAGHLGIGIIAFLSAAVISLGHLSRLGDFKKIFKKLFLLYGGVFLLLGYWIFPILLDGNYHNISVWDGIWKFDSFGFREVLKNLFNGDLFDFGRLPILTLVVFLGLFLALRNNDVTNKRSFSLLFLFWLLLYFGRTTWGGLVDLIPGMSEFHLSRFIVGVHIAGLFLIPIGVEILIETYHKRLGVLVYVFIGVLVIVVYPQTLRYASHNDFLINRANANFTKDRTDIDLLLSKLRYYQASSPGRVFAGRGGSWGRNFRIAETPMYMYLSTYGIPTILWLPETWSPNSDTEQYFSEGNLNHYTLYNTRYVITPIDVPKENIQPFWKRIESGKTWVLYAVDTDGYITSGVRPAIVSTSKTDYRSLIRLWMHSNDHAQNLYPELTFDKDYPKNSGLPNFRMLDVANYIVPDGSTHNLFSEVPRYVSPLNNVSILNNLKITSQKNDNDMAFSATVEVPPHCTECIVILRQSFHPSWRVTIDGKPAQTMTVFPFYIGVTVPEGTHEVIFSYQLSGFKIVLLSVSLVTLIALFARIIHPRLSR